LGHFDFVASCSEIVSGAFKLLPAFFATILVGWHGLESSNEGGGIVVQNFTPGG
jgi:hypothetical protein